MQYSTLPHNDYSNIIFTKDTLMGVVVSVANGRSVVYSPMLMLHDSETSLRSGRFHNFDFNIRTHPEELNIAARNDQETMMVSFTHIVNWLADNAIGKWSFHLGRNTGSMHLTLFFDELEDAVMFKLSVVNV